MLLWFNLVAPPCELTPNNPITEVIFRYINILGFKLPLLSNQNLMQLMNILKVIINICIYGINMCFLINYNLFNE